MAKIIILDDSRLFRELVSDWLEERGHIPVPVDSPAMLVSALHRERPDMVVVAVELSGISGDKVAAIIRGHGYSDCPIVLLAARRDPSVPMLCVECGAVGYVVKDEDGNAFTRALESHMPRRSMIPGELMPRIKKKSP